MNRSSGFLFDQVEEAEMIDSVEQVLTRPNGIVWNSTEFGRQRVLIRSSDFLLDQMRLFSSNMNFGNLFFIVNIR